MKNPMTAKETREMANNHQNQFINTWAMQRVLRFIKRQAVQGYYGGIIEVFKGECELIKVNLEKLGYQVTIEHDSIDARHYIGIAW